VGPIYRYLYSRVGTVSQAEELTSQVLMAALEGLPRYRERGNFAGWLFTIARHKVTDYYRRRRDHLPLNEGLDGHAQDPLAQVIHDEQLKRLSTLLTTLGEDKKEMLRLRFAADLTYRQIGEVVGRSEAAVKMAIRRVLRRLEAEWEVNDG
ncbi:MAG: RNA polymerase sigma factor, partial [Ardenticatenaceae bacterium]